MKFKLNLNYPKLLLNLIRHKRQLPIIIFLYVHLCESFFSPLNAAILFRISNINLGQTPLYLQDDVISTLATLENDINSDLPDVNVQRYVTGMSNAQVMSSKGIGTDYAGGPKRFSVGVSVGMGVDSGESSLGELIDGTGTAEDLNGFGTASAISFNFRFAKAFEGFFKHMLFSAHLFHLEPEGLKDGFRLIFNSYGFHISHHLIAPTSTPLGFMKWGGLQLTWGLEASNFTIERRKFLSKSFVKTVTLNQDNPLPVPTLSLSANFAGNATLGIKSNVATFPIDISSSIEVGYFMDYFIGMGTDLSVGKSRSYGNLEGTISATDPLGLLNGVSAQGTLDISKTGNPALTDLRYFYGFGITLRPLKFIVQLNNSLVRNVWGIGLSTRIVF